MELEEKLAFVHRAATSLPVLPKDLIALRFQLGELVDLAMEAAKLTQQRIAENRKTAWRLEAMADDDADYRQARRVRR